MDEWQLKATTTTRWQVTGKKNPEKNKLNKLKVEKRNIWEWMVRTRIRSKRPRGRLK